MTTLWLTYRIVLALGGLLWAVGLGIAMYRHGRALRAAQREENR